MSSSAFVVRLALLLGAFLPLASVGCLPTTGTIPTHTFHPDGRDETCTATSPTILSPANRRAVEGMEAKGERAVASVLGCHVEILDGCRARPGDALAKDLDGACAGATHLARTVTPTHVELVPLSPARRRAG